MKGAPRIDADEFLDWTHPWRKVDPAAMQKLVKRGHTEEKSSLFEMAPKTPVNLVFTIGYDFEATLAAIKTELRKVYSNKQVQVKAEYDTNIKRCARLVASVGRGTEGRISNGADAPATPMPSSPQTKGPAGTRLR